MKLLITGGAGFIGANFVHHMLDGHPDYELVVVDALTYAGNLSSLAPVADRIVFLHADICDEVAMDQAMAGCDAVVHFAAESHVDRSIMDPDAFMRTNIEGTFTLLEAARNTWVGATAAGACRFVHVSTDEVYGSLDSAAPACTESARYAPNSPYAASKAASDHLARAYYHTYSLPVLITNASNNYGPFQLPEKLVPLAIRQTLHRDPIPVYGDGGNVRDWLYVEDHCAALEAVLEKGRIGESYNISGGNQWTNVDLVTMICDLLDERLGPSPAPRRSLIKFVPDRPGHDRRYALDGGKIKTELGWQPAESLTTGVVKTIDWYLSHRPWTDRAITGEYQNYFAAQYGTRLRSGA
jgi:dTDP-glucose 4,6-dehydratase